MVGQPMLVGGEHGDRERARLAHELVQRRLPGDRDPDERGVERERDEGRDREPDALAGRVHGHDDDAARMTAENREQGIRVHVLHCTTRARHGLGR